MGVEPIPGMALRIRADLKRGAAPGLANSMRIDELTIDEIYAEAPADRVDQVANARPTNRGDIHQWRRQQAAMELYLPPSVITAWVTRLLDAHELTRGASKPAIAVSEFPEVAGLAGELAFTTDDPTGEP
jgi:hypothetical protein